MVFQNMVTYGLQYVYGTGDLPYTCMVAQLEKKNYFTKTCLGGTGLCIVVLTP